MTTFEEIPPEVNKKIGDLLDFEETLEPVQEEEIKIIEEDQSPEDAEERKYECEDEVDVSDLSSIDYDSETDIDDDSESDDLSIGDSNDSENEQEEFEYGEVFETIPCSTKEHNENFDEDIGGESIASASVLATGLIGCSSSKNKSTLFIGLLSI